MQNHIIFTIPSYLDYKLESPILERENYDYWAALFEYFLAKTDTIEIHCWNDENDTIEEIKSLILEKNEIRKEGELTIFQASNTPAFAEYLLKNNLNEQREIKWFTVNVNKDNVLVFHSGHWGTEFYVPNVMEDDLLYIKKVTPDETDTHHYQN